MLNIPATAFSRRLAVAIATAMPLALAAQQAKELPRTYSGPPTTAAITPGDLMTRLYMYAADSMMGRAAGTEYNVKATAYIEREVRRLGLKPAGDSGGYFQYLPVFLRAVDTSSTITVNGTTFKVGVDFTASTAGPAHPISNASVIYGGTLYDTASTLTADDVKGKVLIVRPFVPPPGFNQAAFVASASFKRWGGVINAPAARFQIAGEQLPPNTMQQLLNPTTVVLRSEEPGLIQGSITTRVAEAIVGGPLAAATRGQAANAATIDLRFNDMPRVTRNVVAILPGSDAKLKGEYVAIGAHNDHIGFNNNGRPVADHDSVKAFMEIVRPQGADNPPTPATPAQVAQVRAMTDSLHALHGARPDSIFNGADDDGSGTVSVLEIAEAFAKGNAKPKRSLLFVWHVGEEKGLWGSFWYTDHPTVPRDSIVAQLNMDMVGRGTAADATGTTKEGAVLHGGPNYVQLVGSRRLSTELGDLIEQVNKDAKLGMNFDYAMDANGHPQNIYCRSDHYAYARYGIPVTFFTTGGHADYHQVTDEPQYIQYDNMAKVDKLVYEAALKVANLGHRVAVDKPKPDPKANCVQ